MCFLISGVCVITIHHGVKKGEVTNKRSYRLSLGKIIIITEESRRSLEKQKNWSDKTECKNLFAEEQKTVVQ